MPPARTPHRLVSASRPDLDEARTWVGSRVTDSSGRGFARLEDVWVDADSGEPAWILIREGRFGGGKHKLVPFEGAMEANGQIWLPYEREAVRSSPDVGAREILTADLGERLRAHYGLKPSLSRSV